VGQCPTWWPPCRIQVAPPVQRRKVWLTPTTRVPCNNAAKTRNPLKFAGVPQTRKQISAVSRPKFTILWEHVQEVSAFNKLFSDCRYTPSLWRYSPTKLCNGSEMAIFYVLYFQWAACSTFQTCILNSHKGHTKCGSMVGIQSLTTDIRRGKKRQKEEEDRNHRAKI